MNKFYFPSLDQQVAIHAARPGLRCKYFCVYAATNEGGLLPAFLLTDEQVLAACLASEALFSQHQGRITVETFEKSKLDQVRWERKRFFSGFPMVVEGAYPN
jgi:hypothetical protein